MIFNGSNFTGLTAGVCGLFNNGSAQVEVKGNTTTGSATLTNTNFSNNTEFYGGACYYATA
jgi:hypothetical protein